MEKYVSIDILEEDIIRIDVNLLKILLKDRTTNKNIIWATDDYIELGNGFLSSEQITIEEITGIYGTVIQPRITKEKNEQNLRTKNRAEVFTPSWICNEQNNLIDEQWFGRKNVFNISQKNNWITNDKKILFPDNEKFSWNKYVDAKRMEITCGEAPYLVSRYDTVTGDYIEVKDRIGLLDRKLRIVNENVSDDKWFEWVVRAFQSIYGYEYQGDNLLLARENLLYTFIDNYRMRFKEDISLKWLETIATIISWNIWQMDGITNTIPLHSRLYQQGNLFESFDTMENTISLPCKIKDWRARKILLFKNLMRE